MERNWVTEHKPRYERWGYVEGSEWKGAALGTVFKHRNPTFPEAPFLASIGKANQQFATLEEAQTWVEQQVNNGTTEQLSH